MLIRDTYPAYLFTRFAITSLRLIAPASLLYCIVVPTFRPQLFFRRPWPLPVSIWAIAESAFFLVVYLPLKSRLQNEAVHPTPPSKEERETLFQRCLDSVSDQERFFSKWFLDAPSKEIKRENVKEFYAWSLMNKKYEDATLAEVTELDGYADQLDERFDRRIGAGYGNATSLRTTIEGVYIQHRPLIWYLIIGAVDCVSSFRMLCSGYSYHRESLPASLTMLPFRPLSFLTGRSQPASNTSYWYRKHTSKNRLPIVFIHGIGVGMFAYVEFLIELRKQLQQDDDDGEIGILVVEILPISARICAPALAANEMREEIEKLVEGYGWDRFVLVGHSYGTAIAASILRDAKLSKKVEAAVLMDPICFLLHLPDVAYNFTRRKPNKASEHMLYYFSSQDMMISHTLARRFFWSQYILWKEDIADFPLTATLSGQDIIVPTRAVWNYLTHSTAEADRQPPPDRDVDKIDNDGTTEWKDGQLKVLWFETFNHADLFTSKGHRRAMARIVRDYSVEYGEATRE